MILVTGHSDKLEGIAFMADTNDTDAAIKMMAQAWNAQHNDQVKLIEHDTNVYLVKDAEDSQTIRMSARMWSDTYELPGREGWQIHAIQANPGIVIQNAPW